ncbi:DNA topology modulation protein FlaR [Cytobacillus horneckiae]|uniref:DNA topology modulation protein FlaR n=1 Tax=Cytobacillus horneckiae TaxID=549687 RepID=UPI0034CDD10B
MKKNIPNRIHIIGSVGSGKTTLAKTLSKNYQITYYEMDNVVWERHKSGDIRRTAEERDKYLEKIVSTDRWIIEGVHHYEWVDKSFKKADLIIFLDTPYKLRIFRIIKRYIRQILRVEVAHYTPSFKIFKDLLIWNKVFEKEIKPKVLNMLQQDNVNSITLKDSIDIDRILNKGRFLY